MQNSGTYPVIRQRLRFTATFPHFVGILAHNLNCVADRHFLHPTDQDRDIKPASKSAWRMTDMITPGFIPVIQGENPKRKKAPLGA
jgi:hypothetical protein